MDKSNYVISKWLRYQTVIGFEAIGTLGDAGGGDQLHRTKYPLSTGLTTVFIMNEELGLQ
jgi:hypothetical protein